MVDGNRLGDVGFQYLGIPYSTMDCQAFVEKCLADCGLDKNLAGSNAWYREVMNHGWVGTPEECVKMLGCVPKGAFLFILAQDGKEPAKYKPDGIGNASHIGICTIPRGQGAINSSASRGCVCESKFAQKSINGGWNRVGLWDQVAYDYGKEMHSDDTETPVEPLPEHEKAIVYADNGKPVNFRKRANTLGALIDRIPCGDEVEVLDDMGEWCQIEWTGTTGYMMSKFLKFGTLYCVTIHDLPQALAEESANTYGGSITQERG